MSPKSRLQAGRSSMNLGSLPQASHFFGVGAGSRSGSDSNPSTPLPLTPLPYELAFFKPPPQLLSTAHRSTSYISGSSSSHSDPSTPDSLDGAFNLSANPSSNHKVASGLASAFSSPNSSSPPVDGFAKFTFGTTLAPSKPILRRSTRTGHTTATGNISGKKRTRSRVDDGTTFPSDIIITGLGGGLGRRRSRDSNGRSRSGSLSASVSTSGAGSAIGSLLLGGGGSGRAIGSGAGCGWEDSEMGSSRGGSEEREVEREWTEWEDGILQSIIVHPIRPLTNPYPPGTLPEPSTLDELTNQVFALQARSSHRRALSRKTLDEVMGIEDVQPVHSETEEIGQRSQVTPQDVEDWQHTWTQTRRRLFQIARLESKGLDSSLLGSSPVSATKKKRQIGSLNGLGAGSGSGSSSGSESASGSGSGSAASDHMGMEVSSSSPISESFSSFEDNTTGFNLPVAKPITTALRARLARPIMKRVSSMDFLDGPAMCTDEAAEHGEGGAGMSVDGVEEDVVPLTREQGLGKVLRLSTTLQNTSKRATPINLQAAFGADNSMGTGVPSSTTSSASSSELSTPPLPSRPAGPTRGLSWKKAVRPASLLQRGRSFTADDLVDADDDLVDLQRGREMDRSARVARGDEVMGADVTTPTKSRCLEAMQSSPRSVPLGGSATSASPSGTETDASISPPETIIGSPAAQTTNPFAAMLVIPPTPDTPKVSKGKKAPLVPPAAGAALNLNLGLGPRSPPRGGGLARSFSSCTVGELAHRPHAQQMEFLRQVEPSRTEAYELLAPFPTAFEEMGNVKNSSGQGRGVDVAGVNDEEEGHQDGHSRKLRRLASGFRLNSDRH